MSYIRTWLLARVEGSLSSGVAMQRAFGVYGGAPVRGLARRFWLRLFQLGASFGNEVWFIIFLPWLFWEVDASVAKQTIFVWCTSYYVCHWVKDSLMLPRPRVAAPCAVHGAALHLALANGGTPSSDLLVALDGGCQKCVPGVAQLEHFYALEYGFPSSHTHCSVIMPGMVWLAAHSRWAGTPASLAVPLAAWALLCTTSRIYLGVHSLPDVLGGLLLGAVALAIHSTIGAALDSALLRAPLAAVIFVCALGAAAAAAAYPRPRRPKWTTSPGDTTIILAVTCGVSIACRMVGYAHSATGLRPIVPPAAGGAADFALMLVRDVLGFAILAATRAVGKALCMATLPHVVPRTLADEDDNGKDNGSPGAKDLLEAVAPSAATRELKGVGARVRKAAEVAEAAPQAPSDPAPTSPSPLPRQGSTGSEPVSPTSLPGGSPRRHGAFLSSTKSSLVAALAAPVPAIQLMSKQQPRYMSDAQNYWVEIPCKLLVYSAVGINAVYTVPHLFQALGLKNYGL